MLIEKLFGRRSLENPSTSLSDPDEWLYDTLSGGTASDSGVRVTHKEALSYAAVWRGLNLISADVAGLPLHIHRRLADGGKERAVYHPAYQLLRRRPSPEMKAFDFKQVITAHAVLLGNGYAYIYRRGNGSPLELWPLNPLQTWPKRDESGTLWYITHIKDGTEERSIPYTDVLHIRGLGFDGLKGYSALDYGKNTLGLGLALRKFGNKFFANNATLGTVLERPIDAPPLDEQAVQNLRNSFDRIHVGLDNAHRTAVLQESTKATLLAIDVRKSQMLEMREFELREIANLLGLPPHKLGDTTRTAYASLEQENQAYLNECLNHWLRQWEEECTEKLLTERQKASDSHFAEFLREALVQVDIISRYNAYHIALQDGWMNRDQVCERENLDPLPNGEGKKYYTPLNMDTGGEDDEEPEPEEDDEPEPDPERMASIKAAHLRLLNDTLARLWRRIGKQALKAARKPDSFVNWLDDEMVSSNLDVFRDAIAPVIQAMNAAQLQPAAPSTVIFSVFRTIRKALLAVAQCKPDELAARVEEWSKLSTYEVNDVLT